MTALEKGQGKKPFGSSPTIEDVVAQDRLRKTRDDAYAVPEQASDDEAELSERKSNQGNVVRWLQLLAAVGIPLVLVYLAFAGLVNPQFAELRELINSNRELISSNRDAIAANSSSIERLDAKIDSSVATLDAKIDSSLATLDAKIDSSLATLDAKIDSSVARLEARIDLVIEVLILAFTNDNVSEEELRNLLDAGES